MVGKATNSTRKSGDVVVVALISARAHGVAARGSIVDSIGAAERTAVRAEAYIQLACFLTTVRTTSVMDDRSHVTGENLVAR